MELAARSPFMTDATAILSPKPFSRQRYNAGIPAMPISTASIQEGAGYYQTIMRKGVRSSTADGYLKAVLEKLPRRGVPMILREIESHSGIAFKPYSC